MANRTVKSIYLMLLCALFALSAQAQKTFSSEEVGVDIFNAKNCRAFLSEHVTDTLYRVSSSNDTILRRTVFFENGKLRAHTVRSAKKEITVFQENKMISSLDTVSVNTLTVESLVADQSRDVIMGYSSQLAEARKDVDGPDAGKVPLKGANKYGCGVEFLGGYQFAEHLNLYVIGAGLKYDRALWGIYLHGEAGQSKYTSNADHAGEKYWVFRAESALMFQPFRFDSFNQNRLFIFGGIGFESMETDSRRYVDKETGAEYDYKSGGNILYPTVGLRFEHRLFATGNSFGVSAQWRGLKGVIQNEPNESYNAFMVSLFFNFGVNRNKVNNK